MIGGLIGISYLLEQYILNLLEFPYPILSMVILFIAMSPIAITIFKFMVQQSLTMDLALTIGVTAYATCTITGILVIVITGRLTISQLAGLSFFALLFGFVISAISASLFVKGKSSGR